MVKRAVIVGINYETQPGLRLAGCIQDALNLRAFLIEKQGFLEQNIQLLTDQTTVTPTRANILAALTELCTAAQAGDSVWFSYSGHGSQVSENRSQLVDGVRQPNVRDESDGLDESIVPLDYVAAGQIIDDELRQLVDRVPAGVRVTWLSDSCHSASIVDLPYSFEDASVYRRLTRPTKYVSSDWNTRITSSSLKQYKATAADVLVISGCRDNSTSADTVEDGMPQGAMTYAFLKTLKNSEIGGKPVTTIQRLLKDMSCLLRVKRYTQKPNFSSGRKVSLETPFQI